MDPPSLRRLIRNTLADGRLPHASIPDVSGQARRHQICVACGEPITHDESVMERLGARTMAIQYHLRCFYYWDAERTRRRN
jgi:hypothetical protein